MENRFNQLSASYPANFIPQTGGMRAFRVNAKIPNAQVDTESSVYRGLRVDRADKSDPTGPEGEALPKEFIRGMRFNGILYDPPCGNPSVRRKPGNESGNSWTDGS